MARSSTTKKTTRTNGVGRTSKTTAATRIAEPTSSKKERLQERLEAPGGASLDQLVTEFGWQPHTVRAAISGLRKAGLDVQRDRGEAASFYHIVSPGRA